MKRLLLTGGSGFIGRNLREYLSGMYEVLAPEHGDLDLLDEKKTREFMRGNRVDAVIHAAAEPFSRKTEPPGDYAEKNLRMFFSLAGNGDCYGNFLVMGSGAEYDTGRDISDAREADDLRGAPADGYGSSKYEISKYARGDGRFLDLRLFGVFGKHEDYQVRFISNAICRTLSGLPVTVNRNKKFSYLYVNDLCSIVRRFMEDWPEERVINAVPDEKHELVSLAEMVVKAGGGRTEIQVKNPGMGREYTGNNSMLRRCIRDLEFTSMEKAVKELYSWCSAGRAGIDRELLLADIPDRA
jgi:UDP-glucose 4-epimerase